MSNGQASFCWAILGNLNKNKRNAQYDKFPKALLTTFIKVTPLTSQNWHKIYFFNCGKPLHSQTKKVLYLCSRHCAFWRGGKNSVLSPQQRRDGIFHSHKKFAFESDLLAWKGKFSLKTLIHPSLGRHPMRNKTLFCMEWMYYLYISRFDLWVCQSVIMITDQ